MFYKNSRMTWVANELVSEGFHFFLECMRVPPNWHIWVYVVGSEREAEMYQTTITLFREDEYGRVGEAGFSAQRSYTGQVSDIYYVQTCQKRGIVCVIPRCNLQCGITQPILRLF